MRSPVIHAAQEDQQLLHNNNEKLLVEEAPRFDRVPAPKTFLKEQFSNHAGKFMFHLFTVLCFNALLESSKTNCSATPHQGSTTMKVQVLSKRTRSPSLEFVSADPLGTPPQDTQSSKRRRDFSPGLQIVPRTGRAREPISPTGPTDTVFRSDISEERLDRNLGVSQPRSTVLAECDGNKYKHITGRANSRPESTA